MSEKISTSFSEAAQRYAAALFDLALDAGDVDGIEAALNTIADAVRSNAKLRSALKSPLVATEDKEKVVLALAEKIGAPDLAKRFLGVVAQNRRAADIGDVAAAFASRAATHRGSTRIVARSATKLTAAQSKKLSETVSTALGKDVDVEFEVDPALIGGVQLRVGSRLVDASLRTKLDGMTNAMKGA